MNCSLPANKCLFTAVENDVRPCNQTPLSVILKLSFLIFREPQCSRFHNSSSVKILLPLHLTRQSDYVGVTSCVTHHFIITSFSLLELPVQIKRKMLIKKKKKDFMDFFLFFSFKLEANCTNAGQKKKINKNPKTLFLSSGGKGVICIHS